MKIELTPELTEILDAVLASTDNEDSGPGGAEWRSWETRAELTSREICDMQPDVTPAELLASNVLTDQRNVTSTSGTWPAVCEEHNNAYLLLQAELAGLRATYSDSIPVPLTDALEEYAGSVYCVREVASTVYDYLWADVIEKHIAELVEKRDAAEIN